MVYVISKSSYSRGEFCILGDGQLEKLVILGQSLFVLDQKLSFSWFKWTLIQNIKVDCSPSI